jgi:RNA polymerase sigma factor (sigma-70 family)
MTVSIVYVIDDEESICKAVKIFLEQVGFKVRCFTSAEEFLKISNPNMRGCILADIRMPGMNGLALQDELNARDIKLPIIFMTGYGYVDIAVRVIKKGAIDFLEKPINAETLVECIKEAMKQDLQQSQKAQDERELLSRIEKLTVREREVLELVAKGNTNKQVARKLGISYRTVEKYRLSAVNKLNIECAIDLGEIAKLL